MNTLGTKGQVWVIRHKQTKTQWKAKSGKSSWAKSGAAKNAWANTYQGYGDRLPDDVKPFYKNQVQWETCKFDTQDVYEVVNICTDTVLSKDELELCWEAVEVLKQMKSRLYGEGIMIDSFLSMDEMLVSYGAIGVLDKLGKLG